MIFNMDKGHGTYVQNETISIRISVLTWKPSMTIPVYEFE